MLICPIVALHEVSHEHSVLRREVPHRKPAQHQELSNLMQREDVENKPHNHHHSSPSPPAHTTGDHTILVANVHNKVNLYKEFNISFLVKFEEGVFEADHLPQHNHQLLFKTDNDAIQIEAYGSHYAPNDRKIVAHMRTESGLPAPGECGVAGNGSEQLDSNGNVEKVPNQNDGRLFSHKLANETEWHHVQFIKTHGSGSGKLALIVDGLKVESPVREVQGFQESNGDFLLMSTPAVTSFKYDQDAAPHGSDTGLLGEMKDVEVMIPATTGQMVV